MESLFRIHAPPSQCGYLPDEMCRMEYEQVLRASPLDYQERMLNGWRRFGHMFFRPRCPSCSECRPIRIVVNSFRPNRSQRRARLKNEEEVKLRIWGPSVSPAKLGLYDRFHAYQHERKGWPEYPAKDGADYEATFVNNPFPTEEWCYFLNSRLVGVGYVDSLPAAMSAIYFFHDPDERHRSLGTWNVLTIIDEARRRGIPHVYLGYYVAGCPSMLYKANFLANQILAPDGEWHDFRS